MSLHSLSKKKRPAHTATRKTERRTQEERRAQTRGRLLEAAIALLSDKGYSRFRIADAAQIAGVSRGGQTHYFATKNDLIEASIEQAFDSSVDTARLQAERSYDSDVLKEAVSHTSEFLHSPVYRIGIVMLISAGADAHLADRVREISLKSRPPIERAWIDRLVRSGVDEREAEEVLWTIWSVQRGVVLEDLIGIETDAPPGFMDFVMELMRDEIANTTSKAGAFDGPE